MRQRLAHLFAVGGALAAAGLLSVLLTFFLVSRQPEGQILSPSGARSDPNPPFVPRLLRWGGTVVGSRFTNWGGSTTAPDVSGLIRERLGVSARIGLISWLIGWGGGLLAAVLLVPSRRRSQTHLNVTYPMLQAIPPLTVVFFVYAVAVIIAPRLVDRIGMAAGIAILAALILPGATALWLNGLRRVLEREFVRVARTTGRSPLHLWVFHVLPNVIVSSGVLTQAAFSLAGLIVGSIFVEKVFSLGGVSSSFLEAISSGQAELAATAVVVYFIPLAVGVTLAEGVVLWLQPEQERQVT